MELPINYDDASRAARRNAREEYVKLQNGLCWFCKFPLSSPTPESVKMEYPLEITYDGDDLLATIPNQGGKTGVFPKGMLDHPVHLHHDHDTGMTIGAIHAYCNIISFVYKEI